MRASEKDVSTARERFISLRGLRFHYLEWGDPAAHPLLLMHGGASSARGTWAPTAPAFADRFHVVAPDHRGHGETDWDPEAGYAVNEYAADVDAFARARAAALLRRGSFAGRLHHHGLRRRARGDDQGSGSRRHWTALRSHAAEDRQTHGPSGRCRSHPGATRRSTRARGCPTGTRERSLGDGFIDLPDGRVTWRADIAGLSRARQRMAADPSALPRRRCEGLRGRVVPDPGAAGGRDGRDHAGERRAYAWCEPSRDDYHVRARASLAAP